MEPTIATIHECLGNLVFGEGDDELEHAVVRLLTARKKHWQRPNGEAAG